MAIGSENAAAWKMEARVCCVKMSLSKGFK
jgi:hypothetical protein